MTQYIIIKSGCAAVLLLATLVTACASSVRLPSSLPATPSAIPSDTSISVPTATPLATPSAIPSDKPISLLTATPPTTPVASPTSTPIPPPTATLPSTQIPPEHFVLGVLATGLDQPWEIIYGPDGYLWLTERTGKRVLRIDPADGEISTLITIDEVFANLSQEGLLGMVLHPELLLGTGHDYVYLAYTYTVESLQGTRVKIRRYRFDSTVDNTIAQLVDPYDLITDLPASIDHNGGRLTLGADQRLYYPIGDQGANNFTNLCLPNDAQTLPTSTEIATGDWRHYVGKILRLNLDGSIPADNPIWEGVQSHVYSVGHRNVQGLVAGNDKMYATEHGPKSDDEINHIVGGRNYGWPYIVGYQDDQAYIYANWSAATTPCATLAHSDYIIPASVPQQQESEWSNPAYLPPIYVFGTVSNEYNFMNQACAPSFYICWPTIAPAGMDFYSATTNGIPGWTDSLLVAALKTGTVYRLPLNSNGAAIDGEPLPLFKTTNRYRDLAIGPAGRTFYIITDSDGSTQDRSGLPTNRLEDPGAILVFTYATEN